MNKKRLSNTEMLAAFVIVCMFMSGIYFSKAIENDVQRQIEQAIKASD